MASADLASLAAVPSPLHITLLFKCARHTVLLSVLPSTPFTEIGSLLLLALKARNFTSIADRVVPRPDQGDQVEFGIPLEKKDLKKGFVSLEIAEQLLMDGKGGKKKKVSGNKAMPNENPASAGLVDGSILAFRFRPDNALEMKEESDDEVQMASDAGWNVKLPRFDDEDE